MAAKILVIEDNSANLELMTYLLKAFGYVPFTAMHGEAGLTVARREHPDLIICDIQMPGMDGFEVARHAKQEPDLKTIPLVAVTAYAMVGDRERVIAAGFDGYISKPIDPSSFVSTIEGFLPAALRSQKHRPATKPKAQTAQKAQTILVVDDQPMNLSFKRSLLEPHGYTVLTSNTMQEALALAKAHLPDLILSDVQMNEGTGFDFIRQVKADPALRDIPFLFITSTHWDVAWRNEGLSLGAQRFLFRPMEPEAVLAEIRACLPSITQH